MEPDETPRQLGEDDELPDDFGSRIGDTLTFGSGSYVRAISAEEARRRFGPSRLGELDVTYEMTPADTGKHTFAAVSGHSLDDGATFLDSRSLEVARGLHNALDLTVYDHQPDAARLLHEVRSLHARKPLGLVVVDYVQKVPPTPGRPRTRNEEVGEVSALLKTMARRCDVPVLACAQLNRGAVGRRPGLADLRDSGQLEQDADQVVFLHRPSADAPSREAILAKNRMGPADVTVRLAWHAKQAMFADL
jgi:hypothetical protein